MEEHDKRLGYLTPKGREYEPELCAASGRPVKGKHSTQYYLPNGYYCSVLNSQEWQWTKEKKQELINLILQMTKSEIKSESKPMKKEDK